VLYDAVQDELPLGLGGIHPSGVVRAPANTLVVRWHCTLYYRHPWDMVVYHIGYKSFPRRAPPTVMLSIGAFD
jgi:hypothetical protein